MKHLNYMTVVRQNGDITLWLKTHKIENDEKSAAILKQVVDYYINDYQRALTTYSSTSKAIADLRKLPSEKIQALGIGYFAQRLKKTPAEICKGLTGTNEQLNWKLRFHYVTINPTTEAIAELLTQENLRNPEDHALLNRLICCCTEKIRQGNSEYNQFVNAFIIHMATLDTATLSQYPSYKESYRLFINTGVSIPRETHLIIQRKLTPE